MPRTYPRYNYWASCPDLSYELASIIPERAVAVSYRWFRRHVPREELLQNPWGKGALYRLSCEDNWGVQFFKSTLPTGPRVFYLRWSGYEIYFMHEDDTPPDPEQEYDY